MTRAVQALVLLLFGGALLRLASGDQLLRDVAPRARPLTVAAGVVIVVVAAVSSRRCFGGGRRLTWVLVAPVVAILVVGPPSLGAWTVGRSRPHLAAGTVFASLPHGDPVPVPLPEFVLRSLYDGGATLRERTVRVVGFVAATRSHSFTLARLVITCCAADAEAMTVEIDLADAPAAVDGWVQVIGRYTGLRDHVPVLDARSARPVAPPSDPYG